MTDREPDWTTGVPLLNVTTCARCGNHWYLPSAHCAVCGSTENAVAPAAGGGLCVAVTRVHVRADDGAEPLGLGLVELDEGPVVMGVVHDDLLAPGDRARIEFRPDGPEAALVPSIGREG
jgi:uncharacterized OB-fold protein